MPHSDPSDPSLAPEACNFLSQFGKSEESSEWHSPAPAGYQRGRTKFVVVIGTVMSGLGKGIFSSSLAKLMQDKGLAVAPLKMEGYLNIDSGTLNPYRHGEATLESGQRWPTDGARRTGPRDRAAKLSGPGPAREDRAGRPQHSGARRTRPGSRT